jgi:hypothetical protein
LGGFATTGLVGADEAALGPTDARVGAGGRAPAALPLLPLPLLLPLLPLPLLLLLLLLLPLLPLRPPKGSPPPPWVRMGGERARGDAALADVGDAAVRMGGERARGEPRGGELPRPNPPLLPLLLLPLLLPPGRGRGRSAVGFRAPAAGGGGSARSVPPPLRLPKGSAWCPKGFSSSPGGSGGDAALVAWAARASAATRAGPAGRSPPLPRLAPKGFSSVVPPPPPTGRSAPMARDAWPPMGRSAPPPRLAPKGFSSWPPLGVFLSRPKSGLSGTTGGTYLCAPTRIGRKGKAPRKRSQR